MFSVLKEAAIEYRDRFLKSINRPPAKPWMRHREIRVIEEILGSLKPTRCLEWGAGYSTVHFPKALEAGAKWIAVEHDYEWFLRIRDKVSTNVDIFSVPTHTYEKSVTCTTPRCELSLMFCTHPIRPCESIMHAQPGGSNHKNVYHDAVCDVGAIQSQPDHDDA
jgi:hypothetical protein